MEGAYSFQGKKRGSAPCVGAADDVGADLEGEGLDGGMDFFGGAGEGAAVWVLVVEVGEEGDLSVFLPLSFLRLSVWRLGFGR